MGALSESLVREKAKRALAEKEKEVTKRTNDNLMGIIVWSKKKSRRTVEALFSNISESLLGVAIISESVKGVGGI